MRKQKNNAEINKRATDYARSGEHRNWMSIEHRLVQEGFSGAKTQLSYSYFRESIDEICQIATSQQEISRRNDFRKWLDNVFVEVDSLLKEKGIKYFNIYDSKICMSGEKLKLEIRRVFNSCEIEFSKIIHDADGNDYRFPFEKFQNCKNFNAIDAIFLVELILFVYTID